MEAPRTPQEKFSTAVEWIRPYICFAGEALVERVIDDSSGKTCLLRFSEDRHPFKDIANSPGTKIVHVLVIETDNEGHPINAGRQKQLADAELKGGEWCKKFHVMVNDPDFARWLYATGTTELGDYATAKLRAKRCEEIVRDAVLKGRTSKLLDHEAGVRENFRTYFWDPFIAWRNEREQQRRG